MVNIPERTLPCPGYEKETHQRLWKSEWNVSHGSIDAQIISMCFH
jgi:hypothetical protein